MAGRAGYPDRVMRDAGAVLVLASGSAGRLRVLQAAGIDPEVVVSGEVAAYVASGEPMTLAGGFSIDGRAAPFVQGVDGDPGNVIGLSMPLLRRLLADLGVAITDLWREPG
jgi:septum formation protein